ncbi:DUF3465 domain-containing protein [Vibrio sp. 10N.261.55.A7]|uniref:DUF3465 domain-containing protein n=1 Tax=Vibrio sp. 10N.261.55.A7 TaxID=1880851 RepID=UPI000C81B801|nr:DUF3465 domain-containing protein [Vibrio sp. 10N.261.55.A7]
MKKILATFCLTLSRVLSGTVLSSLVISGLVLSSVAFSAFADDVKLKHAFENHQSEMQVLGAGNVTRILPDDNRGSRHQKFILKLKSKQTLLVAHNIDLAPRIEKLRVGDHIEFYGVYEWNNKGGVIHWTHKDPGNRHIHGWLKHEDKVYE